MLWAAEAEADVDLSTTVVTSSDKGIRANIASHMLSQEECARYLETIKIYENKPADFIQERTDNDYLSRVSFGKRSFLFYHCPFDRRMSFSDFELLLFWFHVLCWLTSAWLLEKNREGYSEMPVPVAVGQTS